jgi:heme-degrading monooxygenase HmoA
MIARIWHGVTPREKADEYVEYVGKTGIKDLQATPGNQGVFFLRRLSGGRADFLVLSLWESTDVIRQFAGEEIEKARYYPEDTAYLVELEPNVEHYELMPADSSEGSGSDG